MPRRKKARRNAPRESENKPIGVLDFETDPFLAGRVPFPFASCIYFGQDDFILSWEPKIIEKTVAALRSLPPCVLYAHNGGKFDFHYLIEQAEPQAVRVQNGRVIQMQIGNCTLKDSWPLMPFALAEFRKTEIDYRIFTKEKRNRPRNRDEIRSYLLDDCRDLLELVKGFRSIVGPKDTIGAAAFYQMKKLGLSIKSLSEPHDALFRQFYFGGRVEAFEKGIHEGTYKYLDINSAYPYAMMKSHPHGADYLHGHKLPSLKILGPCFVRAIVDSRGALPYRGNTLSFPHEETEYFATGWEILAGLQTKTIKVRKVIDVWIPREFICFREYVEKFFALRQEAKAANDPIKRLAYKYLLNSGYGKFAQNPRDFKDYRLAAFGDDVPGYEWENDFGAISLWQRSSYRGIGFYDVATGASITGFVRAMLWRAICQSKGVLYVDTDSLICRNTSVPLGDNLGEWKLEGIAKRVAVAGKKLYAVEWKNPQDGKKVKLASKGARLTFSEILQVCRGKSIIWENDAPTFSLHGTGFIRREIKST